MKESELIAEARESCASESRWEISTVLEACEHFYGNGCTDDMSGDVETFGHFYRVNRWIVWTDTQGFNFVDTYETEDLAIKDFEKYDAEYATTFDTDEI